MLSFFKKLVSGTMALVTSLSLFSCNQFNEEEIGKNMEKQLTYLFNSINNGEKEAFKAYFSNEVISMPDFEKGCNYVFNLYRGDTLSINCSFPLGTGKTIVPGEHICYAFGTFDVITNENEYVVYVQFYTQYRSKYPDGSYKITKFKVLKKQAWNEGENFNDCTQRYGIYYPGWINEETEAF